MDLWRVKTAHSPFRLDLNEIERTRVLEKRREDKDRKTREDRIACVASMTGVPEPDICPRKDIRKVSDPMVKLALEHRAIVLDINALKYEERKIAKIIDDECSDIERLFPKVAMMRAFSRSQTPGTPSSPSSHSPSVQQWNSVDSNSVGSGSGSVLDDFMRLSTTKQRIKGDKVKEMKEADMRVYSAAGKYNESGQFILKENMKQQTTVMSAKYASAGGSRGPIMDMRHYDDYVGQGRK